MKKGSYGACPVAGHGEIVSRKINNYKEKMK